MDEWVKTKDDEAWSFTRQLIRLEGLLVGGSSGATLAGALRWLHSEEGFKKYPKEEDLRQLLADVKKEYFGIALPKPTTPA